MRVNLTPQFIARAKAVSGADRTIFWDDSLPCFGLQVTAAGHKSFVCQYRTNGRSRRMAINSSLRLGEARKEAKAIIGKVAKDRDPLAEKRKAEALATNTLQSVCENYFKRDGKSLRTVKERQKSLERLVYPRLGARQIDDIRRSEISRLLDDIEDKNGPVMADRCLAYLRRIFNWQARRSDDFRSPFVKGMARTSAKELERKRVLDNGEIKRIWAATETNNAFGNFVRFLLLTAVRRDEAANMRRDEIKGDVWTVPALRNKGKNDHVVPLSKAAQSLLAKLPRIGDGQLVFTSDGKRPIGGFSKFKARLDAESGVTDWRLHDLRRTARSIMSRAGVDSDIAERCLGHVIGGVRGVYDRHEYLDEKRMALEALAAEIEAIVV